MVRITRRSYSSAEAPEGKIGVRCDACGEVMYANKSGGRFLEPPPEMAWPAEQGPPSDESLLWNKLIEEHKPSCKVVA